MFQLYKISATMLKLLPIALLLLTTVAIGNALDFGKFSRRVGQVFTKDTGTMLAKTAQGLVQKVPTLFSPRQLQDFAKQSLLGVPAEALAGTVNKLCSIALLSNATESKVSVDVDKMNYVLMTVDQNVSIPLVKSELLWGNPLFDKDLKTVILVTGWKTNIDWDRGMKPIRSIFNAYHARAGYNFVAIDTADFVDTLYTWSAFNTNDIGEKLAEGLQELIKTVSVDKIHLIGHSLGAHIVGAAGRHFQTLTEQSIPRITGLDPANPCFNEGEALSGIYRGDADFVDIIHSNSMVLGKRDPVGDVDFYPNGVVSVQPGCMNPACSHARAWRLYAETVYPEGENSMQAVKCNSLLTVRLGSCRGKRIPMGFACPKTAKGNYFLETNKDSPYGKDED
uniref:Putative hepatic triacylglycerol lipase n=2 Tax=Culex tarsalis TaxID=7177 RepID=A0A1Q3FQH7_CULTA